MAYFFSYTGFFNISAVIKHVSGSFGFSFLFTQTYTCPPNCKECSDPATCVACYQNANNRTFFCVCSGRTCTLNNNAFLNLDLSTIQDEVTDNFSGVIFRTGINTNFFPIGTSSDPLPLYQRGYYFASTSFMTSTSFTLPYQNTITFFIKQINPGILMTKNSLTISTNPVITYLIPSVLSATFPALPTTDWIAMTLAI